MSSAGKYKHMSNEDMVALTNGELRTELIQDGSTSCMARMRRRTSSVQAFVGVISAYILTYITMEMYLVAIISTLEKKYGFKSTQSGLLLSIRELASLSTVMLFSHLARNTHKPRFLAISGVIAALGGFFSAFPHFIFEHEAAVDSDHEEVRHLCSNDTNDLETPCTTAGEFHNGAFTFFLIGAILMGATSSAISPLANTYVDDHASPVKAAFYLGNFIGY